jgi:predicted ATPase
MITSMHIENFKCFKDFTIDLGPFNVLIGPNDSGKTAFLQSLRLLGLQKPPKQVALARDMVPGLGEPDELFWRREKAAGARIFAWGEEVSNQVPCAVELRPVDNTAAFSFGGRQRGVTVPPTGEQLGWWERSLGRIDYRRMDPTDLRQPSALDDPFTETGKGLPVFLDDIIRRDREAFFAMEKAFYGRFPAYKRMELHRRRVGQKDGLCLAFKTSHGEELSPTAVSDGVMLVLAFLGICYHPSPPCILEIEEPENGVHHASLAYEVEVLHRLAQERKVQVILTTHSPYLLDEVEMDEVHVFQKDEEGAVHAKLLSEFEGAKEIGGMFSTGEKWSMLSEKFGI